MNRAYISIEASAAYGTNAPTLEVLVNGVYYSSAVVTAITGVGEDILSFTIDYPADEPSSLSFRFNDGFAEGGRSINLGVVRVNGTAVQPGDLTALMLNQNDAAALNIANTDHLFGRTAPTQTDLGTATQTGTASGETLRGTGNQDIIDAGDGNDRVSGIGDDDAINGGAGDDYLFGDDGNDIIIGGDGNDFISGGNDDDILHGEIGNDKLLGGAGNDVLNGGAGDDFLAGDAGDDIIYGEDGADRLIGDVGNDTLFGDAGADRIYGGAGDDLAYGGDDSDFIDGSDGDDVIYGEAGDDMIVGGVGNDTIDGGTENDFIFAGDDDDIVYGGSGNDKIFGENGADTLNGDAGSDIIVGGAGIDTVNGGADNDYIYGHGIDRFAMSQILRANPGVTYSENTNSFYQYVSGAVDWDTAVGAASATSLNGVVGHLATITSATENAFVQSLISGDIWLGGIDRAQDGTWQWNSGPEGNVQFSDISGTSVNNMYENWEVGQPQNNTEYWMVMDVGGAWHDWPDISNHGYVIEWEAGLMSPDNAADILNGDAGADHIYGYDGADIINGGAGNDLIFGGSGNDIIDGGADNDVIDGDSGDDTINGGTGNDTIYGGRGDDALSGDAGNDTIYGDDVDLETIMEAGRTAVTQTSTTQWHTVGFTNTIANAVVKMFAQDVTGDPFTIRVRNITDSGFEFQLDEFDYQDGTTALETISWMAVASGMHTLNNGLMIDAGFVSATNGTSSAVSFNTSFTTPIVFSQLSSDNDLSAVVTRNQNVSASGFNVQMREQESNSVTHATEQIGWIAIESGGSAAAGMLVGSTGDVVTHNNTVVNFGGTFGVAPIFLADMQSLDGGDPAYTAGTSLSATQANIYIDEEGSNDAETSHTAETVGYTALQAGTYLANSAINGSDTLYGGNDDDMLYADSVVDTNIAALSGNLLTTVILNQSPDAYWGFNETAGTTADNQGAVGAPIDGNIIGGATINAGALYVNGGTSIDFDGVNDGVYIPDNASINTAITAARTVEMVFNADDVTTRQVLYEEGGTTNGLSIYLDGGLVYVTGENNGVWGDANINAAVSTGTTYHVAFVFSQADNSFTGYLNGVDMGGAVTVGNQAFPSHSGDIGIGYAPDGLQFHDGTGGAGYYYNGRISDVALYNVALSGAELQSHADVVLGAVIAAPAADDHLYGGDGFDQLFGGDGGRDIFHFESASAFNDIDQINGFDVMEQDALDISDLLTGFVAGVSDINDFVTVTTVGSNSLVAVDANGATGGVSFSSVAQINDLAGVNADFLYQNGSLITV